MPNYVYLNGQFQPADKACISVYDRGFLLGDSVYEVIPVYDGNLFRLNDHIQRLKRSLSAIRLELELTTEQWRETLHALLKKNRALHGDYAVYLQVTRGTAPKRTHQFPEPAQPTIMAMTWPVQRLSQNQIESGFSAITAEDIRWSWCYIKSTILLPNLLLTQQAKDEGAYEAILIRDGEAIEGATSNLFIVTQGTIKTPPLDPHVLGGITRDVILELAQAEKLPHEITTIPETELKQADEIWITSSTKEILPIVTLNNKSVGTGKPGQLWAKMLELYNKYKTQVKKNATQAS